jgi:hypothetical protein
MISAVPPLSNSGFVTFGRSAASSLPSWLENAARCATAVAQGSGVAAGPIRVLGGGPTVWAVPGGVVADAASEHPPRTTSNATSRGRRLMSAPA